MFGLFKKVTPPQATINGVAYAMQAKETLLLAALRHGLPFPHSCRVGGCASCKCRLLTGRVKQLTRAGYVLTEQELDAGYILACQSVPLEDVALEVELETVPAHASLDGVITGHSQLTEDICRLQVQLDGVLPYKAGQYAELTLYSLPGVTRCYSFATPSDAHGQLQFFIKHVAGGQFTSHIQARQMLGERICVRGPLGQFWLRPSHAPLLLVAGGSGLAPVLALLQDAAQQGVQRDTTLLFGVRRRADLYALAEIEAIAQMWRGRFAFVPVLAEADDCPSVTGRLPEHLPRYLAPGAHAYLCGPPAMVDACSEVLLAQGVAAAHLHADRFITIKREI